MPFYGGKWMTYAKSRFVFKMVIVYSARSLPDERLTGSHAVLDSFLSPASFALPYDVPSV